MRRLESLTKLRNFISGFVRCITESGTDIIDNKNINYEKGVGKRYGGK